MKLIFFWGDNPIKNSSIIFAGIGITNILLAPNMLINFGVDVPAYFLTKYNNFKPYLVIPGGLLCIVGALAYLNRLVDKIGFIDR